MVWNLSDVSVYGAIKYDFMKTDRIAEKFRSTRWALALTDLPNTEIIKIKLRLKGGIVQETATVNFFK